MTGKAFQTEYEAAVRQAAISDKIEPRAKSARYNRRSRRIVVDLRNGAQFLFPPELAQGLADASDAALSNITVTPSGDGLSWPDLDADFSLPGLMAGVFGTKAWMRRFAGGETREKRPMARRSARRSATRR